MPLTPGRSGIPKRGCVDPELRADAMMNILNEFGAGPAQSPDDPIITPVFANEDGDLVNPAGDIIVGGTAYTAGCGIDVTGSVISAVPDGVTIDCIGGELVAIGSPSVTLVEGFAIGIAVDTISVELGSDKPGLTTDGGTPGALISLSRFVLIKAQTKGAVAASATSCTVDNVVAWVGENPTDDPADELTVQCNPKILVGDNINIWAVYDMDDDLWYTGTAMNETYILRAKEDYSTAGDTTQQSIGHIEGVLTWMGTASIVLGLTTAAVDPSDPTFTIDTLTLLCGHADDATEVIVDNSSFEWELDSGAPVIAIRPWEGDETAGDLLWIPLQGKCPA